VTGSWPSSARRWPTRITRYCLTLEAASASYGKATGFGPVIELLRTYFQIEPRDDARRIREKVTGKVLSLDRALEPDLAAMLWRGWDHVANEVLASV